MDDDEDELEVVVAELRTCTDLEIRTDFESLIEYARQVKAIEPESPLYRAIYDACYLYAAELQRRGLPISTH